MIAWFNGEPLRGTAKPAQWCILLIMSVLLVALLQWARLPAALMIGAMVGGILTETAGGNIRVSKLPHWFSQAVIGCLVARTITPEILKTFLLHSPLFISIMLTMIAASSALGWLLSRLKLFPGTTAVWGLLPGAASVMMVMAESFGADGRLVAFMQYLRVVFIAITASVIARVWFHSSAHAMPPAWFPELHWSAFAGTLAFIVLSIFIGVKSRIPAGVILVPMILGAALSIAGLLTLELPQWLLAVGYALLGWNTGLRFNRAILAHAMRTLPQTIIAVVVLMAMCGALAYVLVVAMGVEPLTAYLATSPGGVDTAAIIAASSKVDMPFVMAMQVARLLLVLFIGPGLSRWVARRVLISTNK